MKDGGDVMTFNIEHSTFNIQHLRMRPILLFLALILFASSLFA